MQVAITGASGFIGTALQPRLRTDGHQVIRVVRREPHTDDELGWDPARGIIDASGFEGLDAVVHLAGAGVADKRWSPERKRELIDSRRLSTELLAGTLATLTNPPKVLLCASAIGFYGDRGDEVLTESSPSTPDPNDFLAEICRVWEAACQPAVEAGIRVVNARTGLVQSPKGGPLGKVLPLFKFGLGGRIGSGKQWWSWITLDDELGAILFALSTDALRGPVNLTAPNPVTNGDYTKALGKVLGRPTFLPVPKFGPKLLLGGELAESLVGSSQRVVPQALLDAGYPFAHRDIETGLRAVLNRP